MVTRPAPAPSISASSQFGSHSPPLSPSSAGSATPINHRQQIVVLCLYSSSPHHALCLYSSALQLARRWRLLLFL
uniref:Uncharacterized protein n=1 Tax=Arundo donax TaxID=35708 RepID=A0A0A9CL82_ARUDO